MTTSTGDPVAAGIARVLAWMALPAAAIGTLRFFDPLPLATAPGDATAWLAPIAAALLAAAAAAAALVALATALREPGSLRRTLEAAAAGSIAAAATMVALQGPGMSDKQPTGALAVGVLGGAIALLASALVGKVRLRRAPARVAAAAGIFVYAEIGPLVGMLAGDGLRPAVVALCGAAATLLAAATARAALRGRWRRVGWTAGLAAGAAALAAARPGTADVLPGLLALATALAAMALWEAERARPHAPQSAPVPDDDTGGPATGSGIPRPPVALASLETALAEAREETESYARELRSTIVELITTRETVARQREELEQLAQVDQATRVATRGAILARLHAELAEARRYAHPLAVVLVDLDGLAGLNNRYGLPIGDAVLSELALRLRMRIREADAVGRLVGDVFLAILPHTDARGATVFADAVRTRLTARPVSTNAGPIQMTVSIGITIVRAGVGDGDDHEVLGRAEEALNSARAAGGNRIAFDREHGLARIDERGHDGDRRPSETGSADEERGRPA